MTTVQPAPDGQQDSSLYPADHTAAFKFLDFIFGGIKEGFVEFRYFSAGARLKTSGDSTYLALPLLPDPVTEGVLEHNGRLMIGVGPAPRFRMPPHDRAGRSRDILQVGCSWISINNDALPGG